LEEIYPGVRAEIQALVESSDIHAMSKTLHYINTHGGVQKMADYYNNADKNGKDTMLSAFNKVFKPGARFEDAVLTLDSIAKQKGLGIYTQLMGDVKDSIVVTSIKQSYRTVDDWRTFVRWQHEANKDVLLGVLDEIEEKEAKVENKNTEEKVTNEKENNSEHLTQILQKNATDSTLKMGMLLSLEWPISLERASMLTWRRRTND